MRLCIHLLVLLVPSHWHVVFLGSLFRTIRFNNLWNICKTKSGKSIKEGGRGSKWKWRDPTKNPKINKRVKGAYYLELESTRLEWIYSLQLPECPGILCSNHSWYLKFKWLQWDANPQSISLWTNTQTFSRTGQMI